MTRRIFKNFRLIDGTADFRGDLAVEDGRIAAVVPAGEGHIPAEASAGVIDAAWFPAGSALMPAFIDLHAHFRDPGYPGKETLESGSFAAAAGGYGTVVCMANTNPVIDTFDAAGALKTRSRRLGLIDLYPALALTQGMNGKALSDITRPTLPGIRLLSEDGKDVADDGLLLAAFQEARRLGIPVSCHCDAGGPAAAQAKQAGAPRAVWSRLEENNAVRRAIAFGRNAGCHVHIAHVSTKEAVALIREAKKAHASPLTCEASPHHLVLTEDDAGRLGPESWGRVNPPLRTEADRQALIEALIDGTIDAVATDHAPHADADKAEGAPGFTGLETAFAVCRTELVREDRLTLSRLSGLMSAGPARILSLGDRGRLAQGLRADLALVDTETVWQASPVAFKSRSINSPFIARPFRGSVLMTIHHGRIVWEA